MKSHTTVSIDAELLKRAQDRNMNVSALTEDAIRRKSGETWDTEPEDLACGFCGVKMEKQTIEDLTKGLCWLYPAEKWVCPSCLENKKVKIIIGATEGI